MSDRYGQATSWEERTEAVISFVLDGGRVFGCPFFHLIRADYDPDSKELSLQWPPGIVVITGPKALEFYTAFAKQYATWLKADRKDIESVTLLVPPGHSDLSQ
jgi:hypothetical protein